ncbi:Hypothetical predicted protein [Olea europaea subsp. europaea]|uniref:Uncharacterized protein n=1 Tax=Olea europaea subsp. europaea TaxID=158383 RepID=A0A8S0TCS4_OLEEU|nr:Hypothetical predicted protein [Olea europaea subsp. europaea]
MTSNTNLFEKLQEVLFTFKFLDFVAVLVFWFQLWFFRRFELGEASWSSISLASPWFYAVGSWFLFLWFSLGLLTQFCGLFPLGLCPSLVGSRPFGPLTFRSLMGLASCGAPEAALARNLEENPKGVVNIFPKSNLDLEIWDNGSSEGLNKTILFIFEVGFWNV